LRYSLDAGSDVELVAESVQPSLDGLVLRLRTPMGAAVLRSPLLGRFNASNLLAVLGGLLSLGHDLDASVAALSAVQPVAGRMQCLRDGDSPLAVVDYAHTPDALEQALMAAREHTVGRLWCVFGCGGGRDTGKRPEMGRIAGELADAVVITTDNPREEEPQAILDHVRSGISSDADVTVIADRAEAIAYALREAEAEDVVLIAGKGHETYQEIMGVRYPFNDVEQVRLALSARGAA
ncbi:MAG: UDP-N-acetylmuramyl-tripeptide synthetase, partial [Perlucidibaca sp.]